jgi:polyisoprenoid-binding protein YceI
MPCTRRSFAPILLAALLAAASTATSQTRYTVDPIRSLGWWQVDPHMNHLWAITCPEEPSWRPGEGRSAGWSIGSALQTSQGYAAVSDTTEVPLFPRYEVLPLCTEVVRGEVLVSDTVRWQGIRGHIAVQAGALVSGDDRRDRFAREAILETSRFPEIRFVIDSVVGVRRQGDTLRGTAVGSLSLHGRTQPATGRVEAWHEPDGLRVLARIRFPAKELSKEFELSTLALGLGVQTDIWKHVFVGVDLILRGEPKGRD